MDRILKYIDWAIALLVFSLTVFALRNNGIAVGVRNMGATTVYCIIWAWLTKYYKNDNNKIKDKVCILLFANILSLFILFGESVCYNKNLEFCFGTSLNCGIFAIRFILFTYFFYKLFLVFQIFLGKMSRNPSNLTYDKRKLFIIIIFVKILYFIAFFPCLFDFDSAVGLRTFLGDNEVSCDMNNPIFVSLIHSIAFNVGVFWGNQCLGFVCLTITFIIVSTLIVLYAIDVMKSLYINQVIYNVSIFFYVLFPLFPLLSVNPTKNGLFAYAIIFYLSTLLDLRLSNVSIIRKKYWIFLHMVAVIFVCFSRQQGIYIAIIEGFLLLIVYRRIWKYVIISTMIPCLLFIFSKNLLFSAFNVEPGSKQEILGTLFQQSALCIVKSEDYIKKEDLSNIAKVLNIDSIHLKYNSSITDPVKEDYKYVAVDRRENDNWMVHYRHVDTTNEQTDLRRYVRTWFSMLFDFPFTYLEASWSVFGGYFYNMGHLLLPIDTQWSGNCIATTKEYTFYQQKTISQFLMNHLHGFVFVPVVGLILTIPLYIWLVLFLFVVLLLGKDNVGFIVFSPIVLSLFVLIVCPVVSGNYSLPLVVALPMLFTYVLSVVAKRRRRQNFD